MKFALSSAACLLFMCSHMSAADPDPATIALQVHAGVPLRLYTTERFSKRIGDPVHARLLEPIYAFNREVIPAGSLVDGLVVGLIAASHFERFSSIAGGDFTPYRQAQIEFTSVTLPGGRQIPIHTTANMGLSTIYTPGRKAPAATRKTGAIAAVKDQIHDRMQSVTEAVHAPDRMERLEDVFVRKLPWHPQWIRKGTRFDAELSEPVAFGAETLTAADLRLLGSQPGADSVVHARLTTPLTSLTAKNGERVEAVLSQPLSGDGGGLILPEGTTLAGTVTMAHKARLFHRGGQLRFAFEKFDLPEDTPRAFVPATLETSTPAVLAAAESSGRIPVTVDREGSATAKESKTRLIAPVLAAMIAARTMDRDRDRHGDVENNGGGRTLAGGSGFGLLGAIAARSNQTVGKALGFYGLAWSVYNAVIARGSEVEFRKDAALDVRFGTRAANPQK